MKMAIISPHPDDETLGAGGTLLKYKAEGHQVYWINVTDAKESAQYSSDTLIHRKQQIQRICNLYNFDGFYNLSFEPTKLDEINQGELIEALSSCIKAIKPEILFLPDLNDAHSDHYYVFKSAMVCTKIFRYPFIKKVLSMEILSETDFGNPYQSFVPNYYVDISDYLERKIEAMKIYDTEIGTPPFPRSIEAIRSLATIRGATSGVRYAEAFHVIKIIESD